MSSRYQGYPGYLSRGPRMASRMAWPSSRGTCSTWKRLSTCESSWCQCTRPLAVVRETFGENDEGWDLEASSDLIQLLILVLILCANLPVGAIPQDLKWVGLLAPLDAPHHLRKHEHLPYREGAALRGTWGAKGAMETVGRQWSSSPLFFSSSLQSL